MISTCIFNGMTESDVNSIIQSPECSTVFFSKGETIFDSEHFVRSLGIITAGEAIVNSEKEGVFMETLSEGMCFGVASLFSDEEQYVSSITAETDCTILFIPQSTVADALKTYPVLAENYIRFLTDRIHYLNTLISAYSSPGAEIRLARYLVAYADDDGAPVSMNLSRLSKSLGIGRASLYRAIDSFEQRGYIKKNGKTIQIVDLNKMKKI